MRPARRARSARGRHGLGARGTRRVRGRGSRAPSRPCERARRRECGARSRGSASGHLLRTVALPVRAGGVPAVPPHFAASRQPLRPAHGGNRTAREASLSVVAVVPTMPGQAAANSRYRRASRGRGPRLGRARCGSAAVCRCVLVGCMPPARPEHERRAVPARSSRAGGRGAPRPCPPTVLRARRRATEDAAETLHHRRAVPASPAVLTEGDGFHVAGAEPPTSVEEAPLDHRRDLRRPRRTPTRRRACRPA
jgi:hypothetical protein